MIKHFVILQVVIISLLFSEYLFAGQIFRKFCEDYYALKEGKIAVHTVSEAAIVFYIKKDFLKSGRSYGWRDSDAQKCEHLDGWLTGAKDLDLSPSDENDREIATSLEPLVEFVQITSLNVKNQKITDFSHLRSLTSLIRLNISGNKVSAATLPTIRLLKNLQEIDISNCGIGSIDDILKIDALKSLNASSNFINSLDSRTLAFHPNLAVINLRNNNLNTFDALRPREIGNLIKINVEENPILEQPLRYNYVQIAWKPPLVYKLIQRDPYPINVEAMLTMGREVDFGKRGINILMAENFETIAQTLVGAASNCHRANFDFIYNSYKGDKSSLFSFPVGVRKKTALISLAENNTITPQEQQDCIYIATKILTREPLLVNDLDSDRRSALFYASISRSLKMIEVLLRYPHKSSIIDDVLNARLDPVIENIFVRYKAGTLPPNFVQIDSAIEVAFKTALPAFHATNTAPEIIALISLLCSTVDRSANCLRSMMEKIQAASIHDEGFMATCFDFKRTLFLTTDERRRIELLGKEAEILYERFQGKIINFFILTAMINEDKFQIKQDAVEQKTRVTVLNLLSNVFTGVDRAFPLLGIAKLLSSGFKYIGNYYQDKALKDMVGKYNEVGEIGNQSISRQGHIAKLIAIQVVDELFKQNSHIVLDDVKKYGKIFFSHFEVAMLDLAIDSSLGSRSKNLSDEDIADEIAKRMVVAISTFDIRAQRQTFVSKLKEKMIRLFTMLSEANVEGFIEQIDHSLENAPS